MAPQPQLTTTRKFPNFLSAFELYGRDNFTPPEFNTWTGISLIAGALERKVWLQWNQTLRYYPNMYVMLVSLPGQGKSTALNRGVNLLSDLYKDNRRIHFMPNQSSEARLIEKMAMSKSLFYYKGKQIYHSSGYFFASEASDSLKEIYGDITSTMTNFYDCPDLWQKSTKKDGDTPIENACFNMLCGATLQFLGTLVNETNVMGGFASRINYVLAKGYEVRRNAFPHELEELEPLKDQIRGDLVHDLKRINEMVGPFSSTEEFREAWQEWDYQRQLRQKALSSEKMQSLLTRIGTSMHKLCMVLSAAESSDRVLRIQHFRKAAELLAVTEEQLPGIFREAKANNITTSDGLKSAVVSIITKKPVTKVTLLQELLMRGFDTFKTENLITAMIKQNSLSVLPDQTLKLLVDPNQYV